MDKTSLKIPLQFALQDSLEMIALYSVDFHPLDFNVSHNVIAVRKIVTT